MGLLECASGNSLWRGYDYFKENKVSKIVPVDDGIYEASVLGSGTEFYKVTIDIPHPRRSKCNCPHADGKRLICKHMVAVYFTVYPEEAERIYREAMEYEVAEEKHQEEIADKLPTLIHKMKKTDLESAILQLLYEGPEWQYHKFIREYLDNF
ncbi:MAG: SWIM zinc finger family protein [Clostridia bacterium]|nr:SWIM zinc finger family protein [Clostridia bacterium]